MINNSFFYLKILKNSILKIIWYEVHRAYNFIQKDSIFIEYLPYIVQAVKTL